MKRFDRAFGAVVSGWVTLFVLFVMFVAPLGFTQDEVHRSAYHDYRVVTVVEGLEHPWSIAFAGDDMLVTERAGRLRIVRDGKLLEMSVPGVPDVLNEGQGGLMEVLPHPDFDSNRLLYLSYSKPYADGEGATSAVIRARYENERLGDIEEIFEAKSRGRGHYGCKLAFDNEGYLFITVGDRMAPPRGDLESHPAQDISNNHGTVNRLHDDGRIPTDNPFVGRDEARPEIWSYGHRNPQGLVVDSRTNDVWITEHGPQGGDELNLVKAGVNYGWPVVGYGVNYRSGSAIHGGTMREGMEHAVHIWVPSTGVSGLMLYTGDQFPHWKGSLFAGGLSGEQIARLTMDGHEVVIEETLVNRVGRVRDVRQGPDGFIYIAIDGDDRGDVSPILRLEPATEADAAN